MIFLNKSIKLYLKTFLTLFLCLCIFVSVGFVYIYFKTADTQVQKNESFVPYSTLPENAGVLFDVSGNYVYFYLDFENETLCLLYMDDYDGYSNEISGYPIDFTVKSDYSLVSGIVDMLGGIELSTGEEYLTFTGAQITGLLSSSTDEDELEREITQKIIKQISHSGFLRQDFLYIIENSETNLTVPDCYYWSDSIKKLCENLRVVN